MSTNKIEIMNEMEYVFESLNYKSYLASSESESDISEVEITVRWRAI